MKLKRANCNRTTQLTLCIISEILRLISCVKHHCGNYVCHVVSSTKHLLGSNFSPDVCLDTPIPLGVCHQTMQRGSVWCYSPNPIMTKPVAMMMISASSLAAVNKSCIRVAHRTFIAFTNVSIPENNKTKPNFNEQLLIKIKSMVGNTHRP